MLVKELELKDFRNYENLTVSFEPGVNFIVGPNGSGKTNLVEAIYYLALSRSFKKCLESDLIKSDKDTSEIALVYETKGEEHRLGAKIAKKAKTFYLDGEKVKQVSQILGKLSCVSFDPGSVFLFKEDPSERRRFLDETLGTLSKGYLYTLGRYKKILKERNGALNSYDYDEDVLTILTNELVTGDYILAKQRRGLVAKLAKYAKEVFEKLEPGKKLSLSYKTSLPETEDQEQFIVETRQLFERTKSEERIKKFTLIGVHRDDLQAKIDGQDLGSYCSQGQNRLATFAIKMGVVQVIEEIKGERPVVILDDILSDLDESRCKKILEFLDSEGQTFITLADARKVELAKQYSLYEIESDKVTRRN